MKNLNIKNWRKIIGLSLVLATSPSLVACEETVILPDKTELYDTIDSKDGEVRIAPQELEVPGEDFKLVVEYSLDDDTRKKWSITANKEIYTKTYTKGLPADTKVWIDNIHTDIFTVASFEAMDGITQDSLDDRIHNGLMYGFPISDTTYHYADTKIEGLNQDFIQGSSYGFEGMESGEITQKRYTEEEYLKNGVYANLISSAYGLLIQKGEEEPYGVDASSNLLVLINNEVIKRDEAGNEILLIYDKYGNAEEVEVKKKVKK